MRYCLVLMVFALGCGQAQYKSAAKHKPAAEQPGEKAAELSTVLTVATQIDASRSPKPLPKHEALQRKIIYTATIDLVVEDFGPMPPQVEALAKRFGGYVAHSTLTGLPGSPRSGRWTIRVPVERYEECLAAARGLGEVRSVASNSQDVSEEFYDLQARMRNKKLQEERLLKLLSEATGKLEEILSVERELARVRGEIEQAEGRVRVLNDLTTLTTITVSIEEVQDYVPEESATYVTRVRRSFDGSIAALVSTAEGVSIAAVAAAPWVGVLLVPAVVLVWLVRMRLKRKR